jgi:hypothetical protein
MDLNLDEQEYSKVIKSLRSLQQVKAPADFETTLWRKINSGTYKSKFEQEPWWKRLFIPSRLIPSAALALTAIVIVFILNVSNSQSENPLMAQPRLIEKPLVHNNTTSNVKSLSTEENHSAGNLALTGEKTTAEENISPDYVTPSTNTLETASLTGSISNSHYDFLQIRLTASDRAKINQLKERIRSYFDPSIK